MLDRIQYHDAVQFLVTQRRIEATPERLAPFLPHLSKLQIARLIEQANATGRSCFVAMPALLVENTVLIASIEPRSRKRGNCHPAFLKYHQAWSVVDDNHGDVHHTKEALEFARKRWGNMLLKRTWKSHIAVWLQNPKILDGERCPAMQLELRFVTDRRWGEIINDRSAPTSEVIGQSILCITHLKSESDELVGNEAGYVDCNCAHCGGGLYPTSCSSCKSQFRDDGSRCGTYAPLAARLVEYARQHRFRFAIDPALALAVERAGWEAAKADSEKTKATQRRQDLEAKLKEVVRGQREAATAIIGSDTAVRVYQSMIDTKCRAFDEAAAADKAQAEKTARQRKAKKATAKKPVKVKKIKAKAASKAPTKTKSSRTRATA